MASISAADRLAAPAGIVGSSPFAARTSAVIDRPARRPKTRMSMQRVGAQPVRAVDADAGALPAAYRPGRTVSVLVDDDARLEFVGMPPIA